MECLVCHKEFEGGACPRCGFPVVESTDVDALLKSMRKEIEAHRKAFEDSLKLELMIYRWKEQDGKVVPDRTERLLLGTWAQLLETPAWLPQQFARIPDREKLELRARVTAGQESRELTVEIPNLLQPALQSVGAETDRDMRFRLLLKNDRDDQSASEWIPMLE